MVTHHSRKNDAQGRRGAHPDENHRQAVDAVRDGVSGGLDGQLGGGLVVVADFPDPDLEGAAACPDCKGRGVSGAFYAHAYDQPTEHGATALLLDLVCPACRGCGHADHDACEPGVHAGDDPDDEHEYLDQHFGDPDTGESPCYSCGGRRFTYTQGEGQPACGEAKRAHQELARRMTERGVSEWDVTGAAVFGELGHLLGDGAQALMEASDTTVWLRTACGCAADLCRVVDISDVEAMHQ